VSAVVDLSMHTSYRIFSLSYLFYLLFAVCSFVFPSLLNADAASSSASELIRASRKLDLAHDPQWLALLHYAPRRLSLSQATRIKSPQFFLSPLGGSDPEAEMEETLHAFIRPSSLADEHAQCRYPARFAWLAKKLAFTDATVPRVECKRFDTWLRSLAPHSISLIFPASFLNNPASAFGHTFLRLDQKEHTEETRLLSYAADFAAQTHGEDAISYAAKGIFGGFDGYYSVAPFHKKVEKYSDLENRDIWEYHLSFNYEEVLLLTAHLWELRDVPLTYFYFDENCSYHILALLDVARPTLGYSAKFPLWAMPVDTVRAVLASSGLVVDKVFRPSAATKLRARISHASPAVAQNAIATARKPGLKEEHSTLTNQERAEALDIAFEYNTYQRIRKRSADPAEQEKAFEILKLRSKIVAAPVATVTPPAFRPDEGHKTAMTSIGWGRVEDKNVGLFQLRPAMHALSDRPQGYLPGNQIKFFDTVLRFSEEQGVDLQRFTALDIMALTPRDDFFDPISWRINLGTTRFRLNDGRYPLVYSLNGGAGVTYQLTDTMIGYGMLDADFSLSDELSSGYSIGAGPSLGIVYLPNQWFGLEAKAASLNYFAGDNSQGQSYTVSPRISLSKDLALRADSAYQNVFERSSWSYALKLEYFFTP
jgi:hypothetical protein